MRAKLGIIASTAIAGLLISIAVMFPPVAAGNYYDIQPGREWWPLQYGRGPWSITGRLGALQLEGQSEVGDQATFGYTASTTAYLAVGDFYPGEEWWLDPFYAGNISFSSVKLVSYMWHRELDHFWYGPNGNPNLTLSYSLDDRATWHDSTLRAKDSGASISGYGTRVEWNVTAEEAWNTTWFDSSAWVKLTTYLDANDYYQVDYIGWEWNWTYPVNWDPNWTWTPPDDEGFGNYTYDIDLVGIMGLCGFIGMIGTPPYAIYVLRQGEGRIRTIVFCIVLGMFCFVMFLGSLG